LAPSEALRHKHQHLQALTQLAHQFGGRVVDISTDNCIVELFACPNSFVYYRSAKPSRIDAFMKLLYPFGILESSRSGTPLSLPEMLLRTGMMALPRTPMDTADLDSETEKDAEDIVDVTALPPG
jgi:acetolactate synthase I/III small subunit